MEREPRDDELLLNVQGKEFLMNRDNTSLFTFLGRAAFNHVFISMNEDMGAFVFRTTETTEMFDRLVEHVQEHNYPQHLNLNDITEGDKAAYFKATLVVYLILSQTSSYEQSYYR